MQSPKICLTLTGKTIKDNLELVRRYRPYVDLLELRADFLDEDESLHVRKFPELAKMPCILTIRRRVDGGKYVAGESSRTMLFARAMAFADDQNPERNFQYVDFEEDFHVPSLQDAALAFGTKIIRSFHSMNEPVHDIIKRCDEMRKTGYEIPKIAFMPKTLADVKNLFYETRDFTKYEHILCAMGPMGIVSRILAYKTHSFLTYTSADTVDNELRTIGHIDPIMMNQVYHFKDLNDKTSIYGITGWPLVKTDSPFLHNQGYVNHFMNAVYIPIPSSDIHQTIEFANEIGVKGMSVTVPHKESVLNELFEVDEKVREISASNTIIRKNDKWCGYNTDCSGFSKALLEFTGFKNLKHKRVAIIGAGGASRAIAYAVKMLGGKACVFNRTPLRAKSVADMFGFEYSQLSADVIPLIEKYSDVIIQTTSAGMNSSDPSNSQNDPLYFYRWTGNEILFDIVYTPKVTPIMERAKEAGCKVCNGELMLKYQAYEQFKIFTGVDYEETKSE